MKNFTLMMGIILTTGASVNAGTSAYGKRLDEARSIVCSDYDGLDTWVGLHGGSKENGDYFSGMVSQGFRSVRFESSNCKANAHEVICKSRWNWSRGTPAILHIKEQKDGTYKGYLTDGPYTITMGCLPSDNSLN